MIQCSVTTVTVTVEYHPIQCMSHYYPGQSWMSGNDVRNDSLFVLPVTGILFPDLHSLRNWYVYIATEVIPQLILHVV